MSKIGNEAIESPQYQIGSLDYTKELILLLREHSDPKSSMYYKGGGGGYRVSLVQTIKKSNIFIAKQSLPGLITNTNDMKL